MELKPTKILKVIYFLPCKFNKIVNNRLGVSNYFSKSYSFNPWFITGLIDGEGPFVITI